MIADLQAVCTPAPTNFVPAHPIAGREQSGVQAAVPGLFSGKKVIVTPTPETSPESLMQITEVWQQIGAEVEYMNADSHDQILAATSHLPHALAFAWLIVWLNKLRLRKYFVMQLVASLTLRASLPVILHYGEIFVWPISQP